MQLGYSQFSHSQLYLRPFSLPMTHNPNIVANKTQRTNKQKTTRKQEREAHSNTLVTSLTKRTVSGCDSVKHSSRWRWFFFIIFFFFLKKVQKTGYLEKIRGFFFFFSYMRVKVDREGGERRDYIAANKEISKSILPSSQKLLPLPPLPAWYKVFAKH